MSTTKLRPRIRRRTRLRVMLRDGFRCRYCRRFGWPWANWEIDHIHPVKAGGPNRWHLFHGNLALACHRCNRRKSARLDWVPSKISIFQRIFSFFAQLIDWPMAEDFRRP